MCSYSLLHLRVNRGASDVLKSDDHLRYVSRFDDVYDFENGNLRMDRKICALSGTYGNQRLDE